MYRWPGALSILLTTKGESISIMTANNQWKRVVLALIATAALHHETDAAFLRRRRDHSGFRGGMSSSSHQTHSRSFWPSSYHYHNQDSSQDEPAYLHGPIDESSDEPTAQPSAPPPTQFPTYSPVQDSDINDGLYYGIGGCRRDQAHVQVEVRSDYFSCETSWTLKRPGRYSDLELVDSEDGFYHDTSYVKASCVDAGTYLFTIFDSFGDGIEQPGFYEVKVDGDVVARGSNFYNSRATWFIVSTHPPEEELWTTSSTTHVFSGGDFDDHISDEDLDELRETLQLPTSGPL